MIKFYDQTPTIYSNISRDFQYIGWLVNIVLNSVKHNVDDLYNLPCNKANPELVELLALTLGFKVKRNYDQKQLLALVEAIPNILRHKGSELAIQMAGNALIAASGTEGDFQCKVKNNNVLEVTIPKDLVDVTLFTDLLPYILPAGMTCQVVRKTEITKGYETKVLYRDRLKAHWQQDVDWNRTNNTSTGISELYEQAGANKIPRQPIFANYSQDDKLKDILNAGLVSNTIVPVLDKNFIDKNSPEGS